MWACRTSLTWISGVFGAASTGQHDRLYVVTYQLFIVLIALSFAIDNDKKISFLTSGFVT